MKREQGTRAMMWYLCRYCRKCFKGRLEFLKHKRQHLESGGMRGIRNSRQTGLTPPEHNNLEVTLKEGAFIVVRARTGAGCDERIGVPSGINAVQGGRTADSNQTKGDKKNGCFQRRPRDQNNSRDHHQCHICRIYFVNERSLERHMLSVTKKRILKCELCDEIYHYRNRLDNHVAGAHGALPYKCQLCPKSYKTTSGFLYHTKVHKDDRPFQCDKCEKRFMYSGELKRHKIAGIHAGEKPFQCELCSKSFKDRSYFKRHVRIHTGEKPHKCKVCSESFHGLRDLKRHVSAHTEEKPHKCHYCKKAYDQKNDLDTHLCTHTYRREAD